MSSHFRSCRCWNKNKRKTQVPWKNVLDGSCVIKQTQELVWKSEIFWKQMLWFSFYFIYFQRSPGKNTEKVLLCIQLFCRPTSTCSPSASPGGTSAPTTAFTSATLIQVNWETNPHVLKRNDNNYFSRGYGSIYHDSRFVYMICPQVGACTQTQTTTEFWWGSCISLRRERTPSCPSQSPSTSRC